MTTAPVSTLDKEEGEILDDDESHEATSPIVYDMAARKGRWTDQA